MGNGRSKAFFAGSVLLLLARERSRRLKLLFAPHRSGWSYYNDSQHASDVVDILDTSTHLWHTTHMSYRTVAPSVSSIASLVFVLGGTAFGWEPTSGSVDDAFLYGGYTNLGVDRYDLDADTWLYVPTQVL